MNLFVKKPALLDNNMNNEYFQNRKNESPEMNYKLSYEKNNCINRTCKCTCHCQNNENNNLKYFRNISSENIFSKKISDLDYRSITDNNMNNEKKSLIKNNSVYNLTPSFPEHKYYLFQELKKNYVPHYNYTTKPTKKINNVKYRNFNNQFSNKTSYNNHSFVDIKNTSEDNKGNIKYYKVKLQKKDLSKFYHNIGLKKYPYGKGNVQTTNNANNHKYIEIYGNSATNNNNSQNKKSIIIHYDYNKNENNVNTNIIKTEQNSNNHRFSLSVNFSGKKGVKANEGESKILRETHNTRLLEVKSPSKENNNISRNSFYLRETKKNLFNNYNNYSYERKKDININRNNNYYLNNKKIEKEYNYTQYTHKPQLNISNIPDKNDVPLCIQNINKNSTNFKYTNYYSSTGNKIENQKNRYNNNTNIDNKKNQKKRLSIIRNNQINNINYKILKQKVRLSLLKKQIYEENRNMLFNNKKNCYNHRLIYNNALYEKTRKLMDNNNFSQDENNLEYE
jgi:hypothetical protein